MRKILLTLFTVVLTCMFAQAQPCNKPVITTFSPVTGFIGSVVTINGSNFDPIPANNQVFFGAVQAEVLTASFGVLQVKVPAGATYAPITVRNACRLIGASTLAFNGIFCGTNITSNTYNTVSFSMPVSGGYQVLSQDMDLDGKPDILVCGFTSNRVSIARNLSTPGTFNFAPAYDLVFTGATRCIAPADYDGDGKIDLAVVDNGINGVKIYKNTSTPGSLSFTGPYNYTASGGYQLAAGDLNGDGKMDIVITAGNTLYTLRNVSTPGNIAFAPNTAINNLASATGLVVADIDGNGVVDVATSAGPNNVITVIRNTTPAGGSVFSFASTLMYGTNGSYPYRLFSGDFDKDGKIDLTTCNYSGATNVAVLRNTSSPGNIAFAGVVNLPSPGGNYRIGVGDADGDGSPDIVTKSLSVNVFSLYKNISSGPGNIAFNARIDYSGQAEVSGIVIGDFDGDYVPDIATSGINYRTLRVHRNNSTIPDNTPPVAACKNIIVPLDPSGNATITAAMVDNGSSDACGIQSLAIDKTTFNCSNLGPNNVVLTVTDRAGNVSTCTAVVTVAPAAIVIAGQSTVCQGQTVTMTANTGDSYQWQKDGVDIPGATTKTYVANVSGNYTVTVTNAGGCSGTSSATVVTVSPAPVVTTHPSGAASLCNGSLPITASAGSIYQWSNGANTQSITVNQAGNYSVSVTNQFGCSNTSALLAVNTIDNIPPIAKCKNITVALDASEAAAITAADVNDGSTDNCGNITITIAGQTTYGCADIGKTIDVVLTVRDAQGNTSSCTAQVTVTDPNSYCNAAPVAVCKPVTVSANSNCQGTASAIDFNGGSTDADGDVLTYSVFPAGPYAIGVTTVTLTVTDPKGASSSCTTTITVTDDEKPTITAPAAISVGNDPGRCDAAVALGTAVTADNCGVATVSNNAPAIFPVGSTTVTWTVTDVHGNSATATQDVVVTDNELPAISCPANQVFCANTGSSTNYTIPALAQNDNCGVAGTVYTITGATSRTGTGTDASGTFNTGVSTVTWTVTDVHGNVSICSFTVTINPLPVAAIAAGNADAFCNKLTLTGGSTLTGPFSYAWLYNNNSAGNTQQISLGLTDGDGVYSLYTTDGNGCRSELAATYHYQKENLVSSYTILAYKEVKLGHYNKVASGSVGVMSIKGEAAFKKYSSVAGPGSFVKAKQIEQKGPGINILHPVYAPASVTLPTMQYNTAVVKNLPNGYVAQNVTTVLNGNYNHLTVKKGADVTLNGATFGTIRVEEGARVRFTATTLNIEELKAEKGPKNGYTYVRFAQNTSVRVSKKVSIGSHVTVNPDNHKLTFYIGDMKSDDEKFHVKGDDTKVTANIYMPKGKLKVTGGHYGHDGDDDDDDCDHKAHQEKEVYMTGLFIAEEVESEGKHVTWNGFDCSTPATPLAANNTAITQALTAEAVKTLPGEGGADGLTVAVMPNPTSTHFTLKLQSRFEAPVQVRVTDAAGKMVENRANVNANSTIQIGGNYRNGTYFAEMIQGTRRKVVQLIKIR